MLVVVVVVVVAVVAVGVLSCCSGRAYSTLSTKCSFPTSYCILLLLLLLLRPHTITDSESGCRHRRGPDRRQKSRAVSK
jgi:hypothetical protein